MTKKIFCINLLVIFLLLITACGGRAKKPGEDNAREQGPKIPEVFREIEANILKTMYDIDSIPGIGAQLMKAEKEDRDIDQEEVEKEKEKNQDKEDSSDENEEIKLGSDKAEEEEEREQEIKMSIDKEQILLLLLKEEDITGSTSRYSQIPDSIDKLWFLVENRISDLHRKWNILEADLQDVDSSENLMEDFEEKLFQASRAVEARNITNSLFYLNSLTDNLASFCKPFRSLVPSQVYKMKYHIRQAILYAHVEEYQKSRQDINKLKELGGKIRGILPGQEGIHEMDKLDLSIEDLEGELAANNFDLIQTKGAIVMKNIILIENIFQRSSQ